MEKKILEKIYSYLPIIQTTCNRYGWDGRNGSPIEREAVTEFRIFMDYLQQLIPLSDIPNPADVFGDPLGAITILWDEQIDPETYKYDSFEINIRGDGLVTYSSTLESIGIEKFSGCTLEPQLDQYILEYVKFFKGKENEIKQKTGGQNSINNSVKSNKNNNKKVL